MELPHHLIMLREGRNNTDFSGIIDLSLKIIQHRSGVMMTDNLTYQNVFYSIFLLLLFYILFLNNCFILFNKHLYSIYFARDNSKHFTNISFFLIIDL